MAIAKLGSGITEIKGGFAGNVFKRDHAGQHIQATPRHVKKGPTAAQKKRRSAWSICQNYIHSNVTNELVQRWQAYASQHPQTNKMSETITLTWLQAFMSINIIRVFNDIPILQYPP